jgi:hypothetical protein
MASMTSPRIIEMIWIIGALTMRVINSAAFGAGLVCLVSKVIKEDGKHNNALETSRVTQSSTNKVPEEFTIKQAEESGPNGICGIVVSRRLVQATAIYPTHKHWQ